MAPPVLSEALLRRRSVLLKQGGPWTQRVSLFGAVPGLVRELGADPDALLKSVGLSPHDLADPERHVPYAAIVALVHEAVQRTGCAHAGLLAGRMWRLDDLGLVGRMMVHAPNVGDALRTCVVHQHLNSTGGMAYLIRRGSHVDYGYAIYQPGLEHTAAMYDAVLAGGMSFLRELCGPLFAPSEVLVSHAKPADTQPYRNLFRVTPRFNSEASALRFSASWLDKALAGRDAARLRVALEEAERAGRGNLVQRVCRALRFMLLQGRNSGDEVAQMLAMHRRTLNRRLKACGTTFQAVLDEVRFEVACELLADREIALDDIAAALGYAGVSPFMRTFRRWTGTTPGQWRRERQPQPPRPHDFERANAA
jgi:AraC-like DNA-binding protein